MKMIKVGICLDDTHFAHALSVGLARECRNIEYILLEKMEDGDLCDLILSSQPGEDHRIIMMVRDARDENIYGEPPFCVFRYKESHRLANDLLFLYFKLSGKNIELSGNTRCKILVFCSVSGGCGCTSAALSTGRMLYRMYGCKCLYLNLCPIDDSKKYLQREGEKSLLSLLYYLDKGRDFPLGTFISKREGIDYFQTDVLNRYFEELQPKLLNRLLEKIDETGQYAFLLVDMSNHFSRTNRNLLSYAEQIILLYQKRDQRSKSYFTAVTDEIHRLAGANPVIYVQNFFELDEEPESDISLSLQRTDVYEGDNGLIDFPWTEDFKIEAAQIAGRIMREG